MKEVALAIARDIIKDVLSRPPSPMDDLTYLIRMLTDICVTTEGLTASEIAAVQEWINKAGRLYADTLL